MSPLRWSRVAMRVAAVPRFRNRSALQPLAHTVYARQFHYSSRLLKDSRDPKDPKDPKHEEQEEDNSVAKNEAVSGKENSDPADQHENNNNVDDATNNNAAATNTNAAAAAAEDNRAAWNPPADLDNVEKKRKVLMGQQKRRARRSNMFNPKEFEEQGGDLLPISTQERLLPIQLPFRPVYPGASTYMSSGDIQLMNALRKLNDTPGWDHRIIAVLSKSSSKSTQLITNIDDVHEIGCVCLVDNISIRQIPDTDKYSLYAAIFPMFRARVGELVENVRAAPVENPNTTNKDEDSALDQVTVQYMKGITAVPNEPYAVADDEIQRLCVRIIDGLREISNASIGVKRLVDEFSHLVPQSPGGVFPQPDFLADFTASIMPKADQLQKILGETNVLSRLRMVCDIIQREVMCIRVQDGLLRFGQTQSEQKNREAILHEYLRYIKKELGLDSDDKGKSTDKFIERVNNLDMPSDVRRVFEEELTKFRSLEPTSGEFNTVKSYLEWLSALPWGKYTEERLDLKQARQHLDNSHYGMKEVKDRILEFLAVGKLNGTVDGKIVCLSGPPGVGKTSIAKSIAEALNRKFDRFSVGGISDASEIKGHRRTYVAAMPGRIIQSLKRTQSQNPVILIDEIDKIGAAGHHGSPEAALLEVLDPEQNKNFQDTYLEVPMDLSRVLFLCTANYLDRLPAPLLDRMEVIEVPGYLPEEKVHIASSHLAPKFQREAGLGAANVTLDNDAISHLISRYTRESGVRGLSKNLEKIFRKVAIKLVSEAEADQGKKDEGKKAEAKAEAKAVPTKKAKPSGGAASASGASGAREGEPESEPEPHVEVPPLQDKISNCNISIVKDDLTNYVGPVIYKHDRMFDVLPVGVSMGLGWTPVGGTPLFIESVQQETLTPKSKARFTCTGHVGEVMGESTSIAYSFSRMFMARKYPRNRFLDHAAVHTHFPEGAIKKDGPSAGIATVTSLLSLAMDMPTHNDVAMTGEISLTGRVLQIGGLREKAVAAKAAGAKIIIFPEDNRADWEEFPDSVRNGLEARPVSHYKEVFSIVFGEPDAAKINTAWPELNGKAEKEPAHQPQVPI